MKLMGNPDPSDEEVQQSLQAVLTAVGTVRSTLSEQDAVLLEACLRSGVAPSADNAAVRRGFLRVRSKVDHLRLELDEGRETRFVRQLESAGIYRVPPE